MISSAPCPTSSLDPILRLAAALGLLLAVALSASACDLIWEPPETAAERLMRATAARDKRVIGEFIEDRELASKMHRLAGWFNGPRYKGTSNFWRIDGEPEKDDGNGYTYVWVIVDIPPPQGSGFAAGTTTDIVLEMERDFLRWTVRDVQGIDDLLSRLDRK